VSPAFLAFLTSIGVRVTPLLVSWLLVECACALGRWAVSSTLRRALRRRFLKRVP
jgi:hypothetical protein